MKKACIIGIGNIGFLYDYPKKKNKIFSHFYGYLNFKSTKLVGVSDYNNNNQIRILKKYNIKFFKNYIDMIKILKPDIVSICTPTNTHYKIINNLAQLNVKNILCEKPLSYNIIESNKIINIAKKKRINILVNYFRSWDTTITKLIKNFDLNLNNKKTINVYYYKGLIHHGTHYLDLLITWFGKPINISNIKLVEKINYNDATVSFDINFNYNNNIIQVKFIGSKKNDPKDLIVIKNKDYSYKIVNTREIKKFKGRKLILSKPTNYNTIIKKVIQSMHNISSRNIFSIKDTNLRKSTQILNLSKNILSQL